MQQQPQPTQSPPQDNLAPATQEGGQGTNIAQAPPDPAQPADQAMDGDEEFWASMRTWWNIQPIKIKITLRK